MKKVTNKKTKRIASALAALSLVSAMAMPASTIYASATETPALVDEISIDESAFLSAENFAIDDFSVKEFSDEVAPDADLSIENNTKLSVTSSYEGHELKDIAYSQNGKDYTFKYSEGCFETDPNKYDPHLATMSSSLAHASDTYIFDNEETKKADYSKGAQRVVDILGQAAFEDIYVSDSYRVKPTTDSVACVIASKDIATKEGNKKLISITVRSSSYESEWASNVTLGTEGEAAGFANAADQVIGYFNDFNSDGKFDEALENGDVIFWVHGYSRGGATANLASKRLIDAYQDNGNKIYGYCIEAPQGGAQFSNETHSYASIHNIINPDDLVPYVAPTIMGFKRYGVDHFMFGGDADSYRAPQTSRKFAANISDNSCMKEIDMKAQTERMMKQLKTLATDDEIEKDHIKPFNIEGVSDLGAFIEETISLISRGVGRERYSAVLQDPARRVMEFIKANDNGFPLDKNDMMKLVEYMLNYLKRPSNMLNLFFKVKAGAIITLVRFFDGVMKGYADITIPTDNKDICEYIGGLLIEALNGTGLISKFDNYPSDGTSSNYKTLEKDIVTVLCNISGGRPLSVSLVKNIYKLVSNVGDIFNNHASIQTMAWLRSFDSWYDEISEG